MYSCNKHDDDESIKSARTYILVSNIQTADLMHLIINSINSERIIITEILGHLR